MKNTILISFFLLLSSCGLFNNISETTSVLQQNRDYILVNKTPFNNLLVYISRQNETDCNSFKQVATLKTDGRYPFHVNPGETVYVRYCTSEDIFCNGCRSLKLIGNTSTQSNEIHMGTN